MAKEIQKVLIPELLEVKDPGAAKRPQVAEPRHPAPVIGKRFPLLIAQLGTKGKKRFTTFFTDNIRNLNTRQAYFRAAFQFFAWCDEHGLTFAAVQSFRVSAYVEHLLAEKSKSTVKQHLAAVRVLYDWLVVGQIIEINPAHAVRGPKHVVTQGLTPILDAEQMQLILKTAAAFSEAQRMAGHSDPRTTRLYDRRDQKITRGEVERITILG